MKAGFTQMVSRGENSSLLVIGLLKTSIMTPFSSSADISDLLPQLRSKLNFYSLSLIVHKLKADPFGWFHPNLKRFEKGLHQADSIFNFSPLQSCLMK